MLSVVTLLARPGGDAFSYALYTTIPNRPGPRKGSLLARQPIKLIDCFGNGCQCSDMAFYTKAEFGPDCSLGFLARRIHQSVQGALEQAFAEQGLSVTQWSALVSIWFGRANTCADLARDLAHDKGATTRLVDTLEQQGWVTRTRATDDRRVVNLMLTAEGSAVTVRCRDLAVEYWNALLVDWDRSEVEALIMMMQKLRGTLESTAVTGHGEGRCA